jgi:Tripartite tricarboxylate transporter family receptor
MKLPRRTFLCLAAGAAALPVVSRVARAQTYPTRPVRWVVAAGAGSTADIVVRLMGQWLSERLGQPFVVEHRPGAGANIGTEAVVRAPADGYTLLLVNPANAINATLYDKLHFTFIRDIAPVADSVGEDLAAGRLVPVLTDYSIPEFSAYAVHAQGRRPSAKLRSFIVLLYARCGPRPPWDRWQRGAT